MATTIIGSIIQIIPNLCTQVSHQTSYVRHLRRNVENLSKAAEMLKSGCDDIKSKERAASRERRRLTNQAKTWIEQAERIFIETMDIKLEFWVKRTTGCNGCFPDLRSSYKLGKRAVRKHEDVQQLRNERSSLELFTMSSPSRAVLMSTASFRVQPSSQQTMNQILDRLRDDRTSVICVHGMGGVGKTTLMKAINNKFEKTGEFPREFDQVIWETVAQHGDDESVQKDIMGWLKLNFTESDSYHSRSGQLREWLRDKRYFLILDDLWKSINLSEVGLIPSDVEKISKIVITTRDSEVCNNIQDVAYIKVKTLEEDEAWQLFVENVGEVVHDSYIEEIARNVLMECDGLPLAIMIFARAMRGKRTKESWQNVLRALQASSPEIKDMKDKVFPSLKLSYDDLHDDEVKLCFLYCSLFPEDYEIRVGHLVKYWIMEGFIKNVDNLGDASNKGHDIVERLKSRCLLEEATSFFRFPCVKMHDVIRDLALYIASSSFNIEGPKFLVKASMGLHEPPPEESWRAVDRISLMNNQIAELSIIPHCPDLVSLFLRKNPLNFVTASFFEFMPNLQVLDLTDTAITSLPVSTSSLLNLRALILKGCKKLTELSFMGQLKELQFLNISSSGIRSLPQEMQNLVKLKMLHMSYLDGDFGAIPSNIISRLSSIEDLRMKTKVNWAKGSDQVVETNATVGEVAKLKRLTTLKIRIEDFDCVEEDALPQQLSNLKKFDIRIGSGQPRAKFLDCPKQMHVYNCNNYSHGAKVMMSHAEGIGLYGLEVKNASQFVGDAQSLRSLHIIFCKEMECIIDWSDVGESALQNIQNMEELLLAQLPKLKKLFEGEVPESCLGKLKTIVVSFCSKLKSLFSSEMVQNLDQLEILEVEFCNELEEIIEGDVSLPENPFPHLRSLTLDGLKDLRSIIGRDTLALPSLESLYVCACPNLRLPERPNTPDWPSITLGSATWRTDRQP